MIKSYPSYKVFNISTTSAGTLIVSGSGVLHAVNINTIIAGQVVQIFDATTGTSGTSIAKITCPTTAPYPSDIFDVRYKTGLWIVTTTGASDVTVSYL